MTLPRRPRRPRNHKINVTDQPPGYSPLLDPAPPQRQLLIKLGATGSAPPISWNTDCGPRVAHTWEDPPSRWGPRTLHLALGPVALGLSPSSRTPGPARAPLGGAFPGAQRHTPVGRTGLPPRVWMGAGVPQGASESRGPPRPSRPAPARPVRPAPRPPSAPPLPAAAGPSASLSRAAERTGAGHAADGGEGACPGKGTGAPGPHIPGHP